MGFQWNPVRVKSLQLRLEKSEEPSDILALAAFNESTYHWTQDTQVDSLPIVGLSHQNLNVPQRLPHNQALASPARIDLSMNQSSVYGNGLANNPPQPFHPTMRSNSIDQLSPSILRTGYPSYQNNSSQVMMATDHPTGVHSIQPGSPSSNVWLPSRALSNTPSNWSISNLSHGYGGQMTMSNSPVPDGHWQASLTRVARRSFRKQTQQRSEQEPHDHGIPTHTFEFQYVVIGLESNYQFRWSQ